MSRGAPRRPRSQTQSHGTLWPIRCELEWHPATAGGGVGAASARRSVRARSQHPPEACPGVGGKRKSVRIQAPISQMGFSSSSSGSRFGSLASWGEKEDSGGRPAPRPGVPSPCERAGGRFIVMLWGVGGTGGNGSTACTLLKSAVNLINAAPTNNVY